MSTRLRPRYTILHLPGMPRRTVARAVRRSTKFWLVVENFGVPACRASVDDEALPTSTSRGGLLLWWIGQFFEFLLIDIFGEHSFNDFGISEQFPRCDLP